MGASVIEGDNTALFCPVDNQRTTGETTSSRLALDLVTPSNWKPTFHRRTFLRSYNKKAAGTLDEYRPLLRLSCSIDLREEVVTTNSLTTISSCTLSCLIDVVVYKVVEAFKSVTSDVYVVCLQCFFGFAKNENYFLLLRCRLLSAFFGLPSSWLPSSSLPWNPSSGDYCTTQSIPRPSNLPAYPLNRR